MHGAQIRARYQRARILRLPGIQGKGGEVMAAIGCDLCQSEDAVMMQTSLANGDTISVGAACLVTFMAGSLVGMLAGITADDMNAMDPVFDGLRSILGPSVSDQREAESHTEFAGTAADSAGLPVIATLDGAAEDDGYSGSRSSGALTEADIGAIETAALPDKDGPEVMTP
jgi:hypothetical protein